VAWSIARTRSGIRVLWPHVPQLASRNAREIEMYQSENNYPAMDPCFLEGVFRQFPVPSQVHEVAEKAMLVSLDQSVEQIGISKSTKDLGALLRHGTLEIEASRVHTTDIYLGSGIKDASDGKERPQPF